MVTITCPRCGFRFETAARTNTRCRRCRAVVRVTAAARHPNESGHVGSTREHTFGVVLLSCGHPAVVIFIRASRLPPPSSGTTGSARIPEPPSLRRRVLAVLSENEWEKLTDEDVELLVSSAAARLWAPRGWATDRSARGEITVSIFARLRCDVRCDQGGRNRVDM